MKGYLNLTKTSTSTVNADLLEELLAVWFDYANKNGPAPLPNKRTVTHKHSMPNDSPDSDYDCMMKSLSSSGVPESLLNPRLQLRTPAPLDDAIYPVSHSALRRLINYFVVDNGVVCMCERRLDPASLELERTSKYGHACKATFKCSNKHSVQWFSSPSLSGKYYVNLR